MESAQPGARDLGSIIGPPVEVLAMARLWALGEWMIDATEGGAAFVANFAPGDPVQDFLIAYVQIHRRVELPIKLSEQVIEELRLVERARKAVKQNALHRRRFAHAFLDHGVDNLVRNHFLKDS